jgi:hypothetical protein
VCGSIHDIPVERVDIDAMMEGRGGHSSPVKTPPSIIGFRVLREQRTYRGLCSQCTASSVS